MASMQGPITSRFNASSTTTDIIDRIDLSNKTAIVTGGYSGLGLETVRALAGAGASVIVPARDVTRARTALEGIPGALVDRVDLASPQSIDAFANRFVDSGRSLDILVNSAGIMATPLMRDAQGHEAQFSVNHLGHFRLTVQLWPALRQATSARVVSVSSRGHQIAGIDFDDIDFRSREYDKWIAYGQSKTANVLFALALDTRGEGENIRAFSVHPGTILGALARHLTAEEIAAFGVLDDKGEPIVAPERDLKNAQQGAASIVWCACSPESEGMGGVYCEDCNIAPVATTGLQGVRPWAIDQASAERLWQLSEALTGVELRP